MNQLGSADLYSGRLYRSIRLGLPDRTAKDGVRLICGTADRGTCGTYIFCNKIKKKIKIVIIKMSTSGLVLKNNRERKKERKEK